MKSDIAQVLQTELSRRCQANPRYSLRAFARNLGISPANLSLVLSRKRPASRKTLERVLSNLNLSTREREIVAGTPFESDLEDNIDIKTVEQVSSWLAYAILSLIKTKGFKPDTRWVARRLGVSVFEVKSAIESLRTVGLMKGWKRSQGGLRLNNLMSTSITKAFQRQLIERALRSLEVDPPENRDTSSITFAMSRDQLDEAKAEIRKFRLRMAELFEMPNRSTDVFNLTVQLVPTTKEV